MKTKHIGDSAKNYHDPGPWLKDGTKRQAAPKVVVNSHGGGDVKVEGKKASGRLDKKARGGAVAKFQTGGGIHKITPSKHKPHNVSVNVINVTRRPQGRRGLAMPPPIGALRPPGIVPPPLGLRPPGFQGGGGLPVQAAPRAATALAARPALPVQAQGVRPFSRGGW
jgi:hypothetical protein